MQAKSCISTFLKKQKKNTTPFSGRARSVRKNFAGDVIGRKRLRGGGEISNRTATNVRSNVFAPQAELTSKKHDSRRQKTVQTNDHIDDDILKKSRHVETRKQQLLSVCRWQSSSYPSHFSTESSRLNSFFDKRPSVFLSKTLMTAFL